MSYETVATFKTGKTKNFDVGNFYDREDRRYVGSIPTKWPLEVSYSIDDETKKRLVKAYYNGDGQHPYGGNLPDRDIEKKIFERAQIQESYDYLESLIEKYNARIISFALEKVMDHWNGTKVILNCGKTYHYITEELFDICDLEYDDDFRGDRNYRGNKPAPTPLYLSTNPKDYLFLIRSDGKLYIEGIHASQYFWTKQGEDKPRADIGFLEYGPGPAGSRGNTSTVVNAYSRDFSEMVKYNYCFGQVIPELVEIARFCVKNSYLASHPITQDDFDMLFKDAEVVDPAEYIKSIAEKGAAQYPFENEKAEARFYKEVEEYDTPIDEKDYPFLAKVAKVRTI